MLSMPTPCLRRHPSSPSLRCVDIAGHRGVHFVEDAKGDLYAWTDEDLENEGLRALAQRESMGHSVIEPKSGGALEERAAIVAYLRRDFLLCDKNTASAFADAIEKGFHHKRTR